MTTKTTDTANTTARPGVDRCPMCGCTNWERDACANCGEPSHSWKTLQAKAAKDEDETTEPAPEWLDYLLHDDKPMQKYIVTMAGILAPSLRDIGDRVWHATVDAFADNKLHKAQAYAVANTCRKTAIWDAATKLAASCCTPDAEPHPAHIQHAIAQLAVDKALA